MNKDIEDNKGKMTSTPFKCSYYLSLKSVNFRRERESTAYQKINICTNVYTKIFSDRLLVSPSSRLFPFIRKDQLSPSSAFM